MFCLFATVQTEDRNTKKSMQGGKGDEAEETTVNLVRNRLTDSAPAPAVPIPSFPDKQDKNY